MNSGAPMGSRALLALTAGVLVSHLWVLQVRDRRVLVTPAPSRPAVIAVRRIEAAASAPAPKAMPLPVAPAPTVQHTSPVRQTARSATARAAVAVAAPQPRAARPVGSNAPLRVDLPPPATLRYDVTAQVHGVPVQGHSSLAWEHDGSSYRAVFELHAPGLPARRQSSLGRVTAGGLEPLRFGEQLRGEQAAHFERETGRVSFSNNRPPVPLLAGAQDRLSVLLQLGAVLAADPRRGEPGTVIAVQTATTREAEAWTFTVEQADTLRLPGGEMTTVKLVRPPRGEYDHRMELWLAPGKAYAPVRLRLTQPNGDWVDHQWSTTDRP
jgi:hypothetical protein